MNTPKENLEIKSDIPKVSIIVTAYNIENYIEGTIKNILNQTLNNIEIIIVDDGSTDATPRIIGKYAALDPRIKPIFFEKNTVGGVASAANAGIEAAQGEYIGFADGDDVYYADMFEKLYFAARKNDSDLAMCNYKLLDAQTGEISDPADFDRWFNYETAHHIKLDNTAQIDVLRFISVPWRKLYRRKFIADNNLLFPVSDHFYEDNPFHWFTTLKANDITLINESLCEHRVSRLGQTMISADDSLFGIFEHHKTIRQWLETEGMYGTFKLSLFIWLSAQISWTSSKVDQKFLKQYFQIASLEVKNYSPRFIRTALGRDTDIGYFNRLRMFFLSTENEAGFMKHKDPGKHFSLFYQAYLHIQLYGILDLIKIGPAFLISEFLGRPNRRKSENTVSNQTLLNCIMIMEHDGKKREAKILNGTNPKAGNKNF